MITSRRATAALAVLAGGALLISGCSADRGGSTGGASSGSSSAGTSNATITVAHEQEFNSYNNNTADQNAVQNSVVLNNVLDGFWTFGPDGGLQNNTEFGTFEKTSDDPLTVKYTINDKAVWSDGQPIACEDLVLTWAANSGKFASQEKDENGNPLSGFSSASTSGYEDMNMPECNAGDKTATVTFNKPFADWASSFGINPNIMPAHIVAKNAGVSDLIGALKNNTADQVAALAKFYNTGFIGKAGTVDKDNWVSSGPYVIDSWQAGQSITLKANPKYWGTPAKTGTIVIRFIDATAQAQALANSEIQVARPQPAQDILKQLQAIGSSVKIDQGDEYTFEHLDFNFQGEFKDANLRKAFALCVPRQQIVDNLIKPVNENAVVLNSRYKLAFQEGYQQVVQASYAGQYDQPNIEQAKQLLGGKTGVTVRIGYQTPNQRRTDEVSLIKASCDQAGFNVEDAGQQDFFGNGLAAGNFDVALFAWSGSPLVSSNSSAYITGGGNNNGKYSNPQVDQLTATLLTQTDVAQQDQTIGQIEKVLWDDVATIPIFTFPGLQANSTEVTGPAFQPAQSQQTWNDNEWAVAQKS